MGSKYDDLIRFIPAIQDEDFGKWIIDHENDGTPEHPKQFPFVNYSTCVRELEHAIYEFDKNNPDMGIHNYGAILEENGIEWGIRSMEAADVSKLDATVILALLLGAVRAERFCDGALLSFLESGAVLRWLERLKEIEEQ